MNPEKRIGIEDIFLSKWLKFYKLKEEGNSEKNELLIESMSNIFGKSK